MICLKFIIIDFCYIDFKMKYSTSPPVSRCNSPGPSETNSNLPMPVTYRYKIIFPIMIHFFKI